MKKDTQIFLKHIMGSIEYIEKYTRNETESRFMESPKTQDAVMRRLSIIGEAAKNIPPDIRKDHKNIEWKSIIGLKSILTHEYFGVDMQIVWHIVKRDIPILKREILKMLK